MTLWTFGSAVARHSFATDDFGNDRIKPMVAQALPK